MYKQTVLRNYFVEYLKTNVTSVANKVYSGRINPMNEKDKYPYIFVKTDNDTVEERFTSHTERSIDLLIQVNIKSNTTDDFDDFDEVIENLMEEVEKWMSYILTAPLEYIPANDNMRLFENVYFEASSKQIQNEGSSDIGQAIMRYKIEYFYEDPIVPLELQDFDIAGSIANIQILNKGVPQND